MSRLGIDFISGLAMPPVAFVELARSFDCDGISLARDFFTAVTGRSFSEGTPQNNAPVANTIVTGHSLGGALAGFVANDNARARIAA